MTRKPFSASFMLCRREVIFDMNEWDRLHQKAQFAKRRYPVGTVVQLHHITGEPQMPEGLLGRVTMTDDIGQVHVVWENGSSLALDLENDSFSVVSRPAQSRDLER